MTSQAFFRVSNPVLPGFHPDPSICRVGDDFYIATSSFEYWPGIPIHHSRDLQNWKLLSYALTRESQLNMRGNPKSGGIWAPCLSYSHSDGLFHLIFTDVKEWEGPPQNAGGGFKDSHNYLITTADPAGAWSDPLYLNSSGFDPSLFHDDDGRKWFLNMLWDYRPGRNSFAGVVLQEYSPSERRLVGPIKNIFTGTELGVTEAPHLYKRRGWYYLMTAEGGTSYFHAVTLARSRQITGPYELHPETHLLTAVADSAGLRKAYEDHNLAAARACLHDGLQKAGHGSMVPWTEDEWVLAHLCGRPLGDSWRCPLGRETALQKIIWRDDDWPWLAGTGASVEVDFSRRAAAGSGGGAGAEPGQRSAEPGSGDSAGGLWQDDFDGDRWDLRFNTLRGPADEEYYSLRERSGWLRLRGADSMLSRFKQSVLLRRVQHLSWSAETCVDFSPESFQQMAGLIIRYDESTQLLLRISNTDGQRTLGIISLDLQNLDLPTKELPLATGPVELGVDVNMQDLRLRWRQGQGDWKIIDHVFDASIYSDDYVKPMGFTGAYVGLACFDLSGRKLHADFDYLKYRGR